MTLSSKDLAYLKVLTQRKATLYELAEHFQIHSQTVLGHIQSLVDRGLVEEYPFRKGKQKQYIAVESPDGKPIKVPVIVSSGKRFPVTGSTVAMTKTQMPAMRTNWIAKIILTNLYRELTLDENGNSEVFGSFKEYRSLAQQIFDYMMETIDFLGEVLVRDELWSADIVNELDDWQQYGLTPDDLLEISLETQQLLLDPDYEITSAIKRWNKQLELGRRLEESE
jgi:hypothetical protein